VFLAYLLKKAGYIDTLLRNESLFGYCISHGAHPSIIRCMLEAGCNPYYLDERGQTIFHLMALSDSLSAEYAIAYIHLFSGCRLDVDQKDLLGKTPLILAIHANNISLVFAFLSYGANTYVRDHEGRDAFYYSVVQARSLDMYLYLSSFVEPPFDSIDREGLSIVDYFVYSMNDSSDLPLLKQMISDGADLWRESLSFGECVSPIDALLCKDCKIISQLLKFIPVNTQDYRGDTMLHKLCRSALCGDNSMDQLLLDKVKLLVRRGANPEIVNDQNKTAMELALDDPQKSLVVDFLSKSSVSLGARFFLRDWWHN
jgi:hypothetical protein